VLMVVCKGSSMSDYKQHPHSLKIMINQILVIFFSLLSCGFDYRSGRGVQHYVIWFTSDLRQVSGFLRRLWFCPSIKLTATI